MLDVLTQQAEWTSTTLMNDSCQMTIGTRLDARSQSQLTVSNSGTMSIESELNKLTINQQRKQSDSPDLKAATSNNETVNTINSLQQVRANSTRHRFQVDYNKLEADLVKEVEADELYWIQNAAKIRAVKQPGTYEEFRQIVLGAHLKALKKEESEALLHDALKGHVVWNPLIKGGKDVVLGKAAESICKTDQHRDVELEFDLPNSVTEFSRTWKKYKDVDARLSYLKFVLMSETPQNGSLLRVIFANEVPPDILPEIVEAVVAKINSGDASVDARNVLEILWIISESERFSLTLRFMTPSEVASTHKIIQWLEAQIEEIELPADTNFQEQTQKGLLNEIKIRYMYTI